LKLEKAILVLVFFMLAVSPVAYGANVSAASFTFSPINLSNDSGASTAPVVATVNNGGNQYVYVAWMDTTPGKATTFFAVSVNGAAFSAPIEFTGLKGPANPNTSAVQIAATGKYVYLTWKQGPATAYAASSDNGVHFVYGLLSAGSAPGQTSGAPAGTMTAQAVSTNGTSAYFTWADTPSSGGNNTIQFVVTHDAGAHFTSPVQLNTGPAAPHNPREDESFALGDYAYVTWDSIWFSASTNGGNVGTWSVPVFLKPTNCVFPCLGREPMIFASGTNVYVTFPMGGWNGTIPYTTMIVVSHDNGKTFNAPQDLSGATLSNTREVQVTSFGKDVYVTSRGTLTGIKGTQQYVYVSTNSGDTFSAPIPLASSPQSGPENGFGGFALDQTTGNVYVQWPHGQTSQLYISESTNVGTTWSAAQQVSASTSGVVAMGDPNGGQGPLAAADHGHIYIVWEDTSTGNGDIFFASASSL
jgi:hypothetical protein